MKIWKILLFVVILLPRLILANSYTKIEYDLTPLLDKKVPALKVEARIYGKFDKQVILELPDHWASANYSKQIKNIKYAKDDKLTTNKDGAKKLIINPPKNNFVTVSYEIEQLKGDSSKVHGAIIRKNLIHSPGHGLFVLPEDLENDQQIEFMIKWHNLPKNWQTISSHSTKSVIKFSNDLHKLVHAVYVAGKLRISEISDTKNQIYVSLHGKFDMSDNVIISWIDNIIKSQRSFFNDHDFPYYIMSLIEGDTPRSMGGTGLHNCFTAYLPKGMTKNEYYMLLAHEHLHNWIGGKLTIPREFDEKLNYWFSEGFTDYYSRIIAFRSGDITTSEFITEVNDILRKYYALPVINEPNSRIMKDFWQDYDVRKLPYYRGFTFAIYLNDLIKKNSTNYSLDNVLLDLFHSNQNPKFTVENFQIIAKKYVGRSIDAEIKKFITQGDTISLEDLMDELPLEKLIIGHYDPGFDGKSFSEDMIIRNIDPKSNAYKAGLRNGDQAISFEIAKDRIPDQVVTIRTKDRVFKFMPESPHDKRIIYQIKTELTAEEELILKKFFGKE